MQITTLFNLLGGTGDGNLLPLGLIGFLPRVLATENLLWS